MSDREHVEPRSYTSIRDQYWMEFLEWVKADNERRERDSRRRLTELKGEHPDINTNLVLDIYGHQIQPVEAEFWRWYMDNKMGEK